MRADGEFHGAIIRRPDRGEWNLFEKIRTPEDRCCFPDQYPRTNNTAEWIEVNTSATGVPNWSRRGYA
jgi:hypothetical protein